MAGDQLNVGDGKLVVTVILPLLCPQVVIVGVALAVGRVLGDIVAVAVVEHPPPVTVTVYVPGARPVGF
jgi:ABC-type phosphate transport system permease subunit